MDQNERIAMLYSFMYEIYRATASLMYLLQGMESVRHTELRPYDQLPEAERQRAGSFAKLSYVDVPLTLAGASFDLHEVLDREGDAEQLAFKGWVEHIYNHVWEAKYRNRFNDGTEGDNLMRPETSPMGDLRHIRDDLIHHRGVATESNTGRCAVLKWFEPGDRIVLGMGHVFDFLNHMALMQPTGAHTRDGQFALWAHFPSDEDALNSRDVRLVSCRVHVGSDQADSSVYYVVSLVFENGVFASLWDRVGPSDRPWREWLEFAQNFGIDGDGNLCFPDGRIMSRQGLYRQAVEAFLNPSQNPEGIQDAGPWYRFRQ